MDQLSSTFLHTTGNFVASHTQKQPVISRNITELYSSNNSTTGLAHCSSDIYRPWVNSTPSTSNPRDHSNLICYDREYCLLQESHQAMIEPFQLAGIRPDDRRDVKAILVKDLSVGDPCVMDTAQIIRSNMDTIPLSPGCYNTSQSHSEQFKCIANSQSYSGNKPASVHPLMQNIGRMTRCSLDCKGLCSEIIRDDYSQVKDSQQNTVVSTKSSSYSTPLSFRVGLLHLQFNAVLSPLVKNTAEWTTIHQLQTMYETVASDIHSQYLIMTYSETGKDMNTLSSYYMTLYEKLITKVENSLRKFQDNRKLEKKVFYGKEVSTKSEKVSKGSYMEDLIEKCASRGYLQPKVKQNELPAEAINIMTTWFQKNAEYPYPSSEAYQRMSAAGNITVTQARKWFANKRIRSGFTKGLKAFKRGAKELEQQPRSKRMKLL